MREPPSLLVDAFTEYSIEPDGPHDARLRTATCTHTKFGVYAADKLVSHGNGVACKVEPETSLALKAIRLLVADLCQQLNGGAPWVSDQCNITGPFPTAIVHTDMAAIGTTLWST